MIDKLEDKKINLLDLDESASDTFKVYSTPKTITKHEFYLSESIENNFQYTEILHKIRQCEKEDKVIFYLACVGGSCSTGFQLINAAKDCKAHVTMVVDAPCYSMAAIMACAGNALIMKPGTFLMFHNYSSFERGKGAELIMSITEHDKWLRYNFSRICFPFLTKKELNYLGRDQDLYVHQTDEGLKDRIARHFK